MSDPVVHLNGALIPISKAQVSVMDRGFLFGDGVYEVIPVYNGHLFRLQQHLQRLQNSLDAIRIPNPHSNEQWQHIISQVVAENPSPNQSVYVQVTRGVAAKRDHAFPDDMTPSVFVMANELAGVDKSELAQGVSAVTKTDIRWTRCDIKAITLLANVLMRREAKDENATEAILIHDGLAVEGAASNLFIVSAGQLITPPVGPTLLPGITRDLVIELAQSNQIDYQETDITQAQLMSADEIWLTSSTREILPVLELDHQAVGQATPGPLWHQMIDLYQAYKKTL